MSFGAAVLKTSGYPAFQAGAPQRRELSRVVLGDAYRETVKWRGREELGVERGTPILLRFRLERAKLYWVEFD